MNKIGSSTTLAIVLAATSISDGEVPKGLSVVPKIQAKVQGSVPLQECGITQEGSGILVIFGSLLVGVGLANPASSWYEKRTPPEKRVGARVVRMLGEDNDVV